jgi:hypothetical protein
MSCGNKTMLSTADIPTADVGAVAAAANAAAAGKPALKEINRETKSIDATADAADAQVKKVKLTGGCVSPNSSST